MLPLLLLLVAAQVPAVPGETTLVSFCKQGRLSACQTLKQVDPQKLAKIEAEGAKSTLRQEALRRVAEEEPREQQAAGVAEAEADAAPKPPDCNGQGHHVISRPIAEELERHKALRGLYKPRDERFLAKAKDQGSHCGYQKWHREVDAEVIQWLKDHPNATRERFEKFLREIYDRPAMRARFPHGF